MRERLYVQAMSAFGASASCTPSPQRNSLRVLDESLNLEVRLEDEDAVLADAQTFQKQLIYLLLLRMLRVERARGTG